MNFKDWIYKITADNKLCRNYTERVNNAMSKKELMDIVLDANGVSYLLEMDEAGYGLPYEVITREFGNYINGRYKAEFRNKSGNGYSSKIYCCHSESDSINIDTTATVILGSKVTANIKENDFVKLYVDRNSEVYVVCPSSSRCIVEYSGGALIRTSNDGNVEFIKRKNGI